MSKATSITVNKIILPIRIRNAEIKNSIRKLILDTYQFRNLLIMLIKRYYKLYNKSLLNPSVLYGLISMKYSGKYKKEFDKAMENIQKDEKLKEILNALNKQKEVIGNTNVMHNMIRQVVQDFTNYFSALKVYNKNPQKFTSMPKPPKTKKLKELINSSITITGSIIKRDNDNMLVNLRNKEKLSIKLPKDFSYKITSARLKVFASDVYADIVYDKPEQIMQPKGDYIAGINLGVDELISVVSNNPIIRSFIVSGKEIKAYIQWSNKHKSLIQSQIDHLKKQVANTNNKEELQILKQQLKDLEMQLKLLSAHRKRRIDTDFHKITKRLVDILYETGHKTIYVARVSGQQYISIPFERLVALLKYKAQRYGMKVIEVDRKYTTRTSPFANIIKIQKEDNLSLCNGEKEKNIFKDYTVNKIMHADLVGALNIMRVGSKTLKFDFYDNTKLFFIKLCNPIRFKLVDFIYKAKPELLYVNTISKKVLETEKQ
jgi:IS605 OrfB family transposase